jgi:hypothetical protein
MEHPLLVREIKTKHGWLVEGIQEVWEEDMRLKGATKTQLARTYGFFAEISEFNTE